MVPKIVVRTVWKSFFRFSIGATFPSWIDKMSRNNLSAEVSVWLQPKSVGGAATFDVNFCDINVSELKNIFLQSSWSSFRVSKMSCSNFSAVDFSSSFVGADAVLTIWLWWVSFWWSINLRWKCKNRNFPNGALVKLKQVRQLIKCNWPRFGDENLFQTNL